MRSEANGPRGISLDFARSNQGEMKIFHMNTRILGQNGQVGRIFL